jgi:hypothetical protein
MVESNEVIIVTMYNGVQRVLKVGLLEWKGDLKKKAFSHTI